VNSANGEIRWARHAAGAFAEGLYVAGFGQARRSPAMIGSLDVMHRAMDDNMQLRLREFWHHLSVMDAEHADDLTATFDTAVLRDLWSAWSGIGAYHTACLAEGFDTQAEPYQFKPLKRAA
jgi:hypothetical protein